MITDMEKPQPISAVVTPCDPFRIVDFPQLDPAPVPMAIEGKPATGRKMPFTYSPGPISIILLKIRAIESYSANADRLTRQRQFYTRVKRS